jgi:hypothetical protein
MSRPDHPPVRDAYAAHTNQGFLGRETAAAARMLLGGVTPKEVRTRIVDDNVFQLTSPASRKTAANAVLPRLEEASAGLLDLLASDVPDVRRLTTLYVILLQHRLLREFMTDVVVPKAGLASDAVTGTDVSAFMERVASQQPDVSAWSASTRQKAASNLVRVLTDAGLLQKDRSGGHTVQVSWVPQELRSELDQAGRSRFLTLLLDRGGTE